MAGRGVAWRGMAGHGMARHGRQGKAWQGMAWRGRAWLGRAWQANTTEKRIESGALLSISHIEFTIDIIADCDRLKHGGPVL